MIDMLDWSDLGPGDVILLHPADWALVLEELGATSLCTVLVIAGTKWRKDELGVAPQGTATVRKAWHDPLVDCGSCRKIQRGRCQICGGHLLTMEDKKRRRHSDGCW